MAQIIGTNIAWDGTHEEGLVSRPGFKYPYVYVIQPTDDGDRLAWGVYSQSHAQPFWAGTASNLDDAHTQIAAAPDTPRT